MRLTLRVEKNRRLCVSACHLPSRRIKKCPPLLLVGSPFMSMSLGSGLPFFRRTGTNCQWSPSRRYCTRFTCLGICSQSTCFKLLRFARRPMHMILGGWTVTSIT